MALNPRLELRAQQKLALTPTLRTRLGILRMAPAELDETLAAEAARNPFLRYERRYQGGGVPAGAEENLQAQEAPFQEDLRRQVARMGLPERMQALVLLLITELRGDGYLDAGLDELAREYGLDEDELAEALTHLQRCEPAGVGARNLPECLELQLLELGLSRPEARATVGLLPQFARMEWKRIGTALGLDPEGVRSRARLLRSLSPHPVPDAAPAETETAVLIADLRLVRPEGGETTAPLIELADPGRGGPRLDLAMVQKAATEDFAPELLARARALLSALEQRGRTLARIGAWLLETQAEFFRDGAGAMAPATQLELAQALELHPSTISRALAGKAIDVDGRLMPLTEFFSTALPGPEGVISARAVQRRIAELVAAEPPRKPLSDEALVNLLREQGVDIARRTVAKYRQGLRIPSSSTRRRLAETRDGARTGG